MFDLFFWYWLIFIVALLLILGSFALGGWLAAPWVPLWKNDVRRMLKLANVKPGEKVHDLGVGDGRIIIIAAKEFGAKSTGFEIAFLPFILAYIKILLLGLRAEVQLKYGNFFSKDLSQADIITAFLTPSAMLKLKEKLEKEAKPGCRIISYAFAIPGWVATKIDKPNKKTAVIYLYQR